MGPWYSAVTRGEDPAPFLKALDIVQSLLPAEGYAVGQWNIVDAAVSFFAHAEVTFKNDIGKYEVGKGKALWATVESGPKYTRFGSTGRISRAGTASRRRSIPYVHSLMCTYSAVF